MALTCYLGQSLVCSLLFSGYGRGWYGSVGPAGMSADVVKRLNETQVATLKAPDLAEKLAGEAVEPWPMTPDQFGQYIRSEVERWTKLARARNIQLDE